MENKKREVRIAYKFKFEYRVYESRDPDKENKRFEKTYCYGLFTDVESIDMNLQNYEIFLDIEKKYSPKSLHEDWKYWGWYLDDNEDLSGVREYHSIQNKEVDELNEALSERLGMVFVEAGKDDVIPNKFYSILNNGLFVDFERSRINTIASIETEIEKIDEQISELKGRKYSLREYGLLWKHRCAFAANLSLEKIVKEKRININEKIPHLDLYPLEIAQICENKELYEILLSQGATKGLDGYRYHYHPLIFNSWYGFFLLFPKVYKLERNDSDYIIRSLHELLDNEIKALLIGQNKHFKYKDLKVNGIFIKKIRECIVDYHGSIDDDDIIYLLKVLISEERYKVINILKKFSDLNLEFISDFDFLLLRACLETKNLNALKKIKLRIRYSYFDEKFYYFSLIKNYYNEEYLGSEMMEYIKANIIDTSQYHSDEAFL